MELLYIWVYKTENELYQKQGISFSDKYYISYDENENKLSIIKNKKYLNIFKNNVITNVSAIVGANGVGKTTLMSYIYQTDVMNEDYYASEPFNEQYKTIQIFENNNSELLIFYNFGFNDLTIESKDTDGKNIECKKILMTKDNYINMIKNRNLLETITKVYATNDNYSERSNCISHDNYAPSDLTFSQEAMSVYKENFYKRCVNYPEYYIDITKYNVLQDVIINKITNKQFQSLCDTLYFEKLIQSEKKANNKFDESFFYKNINTELSVSCSLLTKLLIDSRNKQKLFYNSLFDKDIDKNKIPKNKENTWKKLYNSITDDGNKNIDIYNYLKLNWIYELDYIFDIIENIKLFENINNNTENTNNIFFEQSLEYILNEIQEIYKDKNEIKQIISYYKNGINEITNFKKIINKYADNTYRRKGIIGYDTSVYKFSYKSNKKLYTDFLTFIKQCVSNKNSFILKHLNIENIKLSSGERAMLNIFSWINSLYYFENIDKTIENSTRENILLLIDEVDLYLHPEWQRIALNFLITELTNQFPNKKIQLILSTHSPIVLSDIPKSNTVFISKVKKDNDNYKAIIEKRENHSETFAANIYMLFNDSFFLSNKGAMGEYANNTINNIFKCLNCKIYDKDDCTPYECNKFKKQYTQDEIRFIIDNIGQSIIQNKLDAMYNKAFHDYDKISSKAINSSIQDKSKLVTLLKQVESQLNEINTILKLDGGNNDKN